MVRPSQCGLRPRSPSILPRAQRLEPHSAQHPYYQFGRSMPQPVDAAAACSNRQAAGPNSRTQSRTPRTSGQLSEGPSSAARGPRLSRVEQTAQPSEVGLSTPAKIEELSPPFWWRQEERQEDCHHCPLPTRSRCRKREEEREYTVPATPSCGAYSWCRSRRLRGRSNDHGITRITM